MFTKLTERHEESKRILYAVIVDAGEGDPRAEVAFDTLTLRPHDHGKHRVGQPRSLWVVEAAKEFLGKKKEGKA